MKKLIEKLRHTFDYFKKTIKKLRDPYWRARCRYIKYYEALPIEEHVILLESQSATKIDGNIFYIIKYISQNNLYSNFKIYLSSWGRYVRKIKSVLLQYNIKNVNIVLYSSDEYVRLLASAKYLVNDATFPFYYIKKEGQVYLNTWHGTPLKTMGKSVHDDVQFGNVQKNMVVSNYLLYTNEFSKEAFIQDYMLENISNSSYIMAGYPRNEIFFDNERSSSVRKELGLEEKRVYAYMPTWRGTVREIGSEKERTYLLYFFYELDKRLTDDEILYINLHPMAMHAKDNVALKSFKHIKRFPSNYETYDFLNICDVLVTDYSSVFFDFACTRKKIVLFPYDKEEYLQDRGMYFSMDELPFPQVVDIVSLLEELRSEKNYDDSEFWNRFTSYDNTAASQQLCDFVLLGKDTGLKAEKIPDNGKENILLYAGNLSQNGITTSLRSLLNSVDTDKQNYIISFCQGKAKNNAAQLHTFRPEIQSLAIAEYANLTVWDRAVRKLFRMKWIKAKQYMKLVGKRFDQEWLRAYGNARIDTAIQFCGYEDEITLLYSRFPNNGIFVHNDMLSEIRTRRNQRYDVLQYAYQIYHHVVAVSEDIIPPTAEISGKKENITVVHNLIDYHRILKKGEEKIELDQTAKCSVPQEHFEEVMHSDVPKFINIGRFSPEKGHERLVSAFSRLLSDYPDAYLIIMGGNSRRNGYSKLKEKVLEMGLEERVILLLQVSNPYPILKACNYFIMSSFYEGLPMTLFEADIFRKPIASTDVSGPHGFLSKYGGILVEDSEDGIYEGMKKLYANQTNLLSIDYQEYNDKCLREFEILLGR
ncbi:MAG: glycosyltransferase [Oscillospiraceae bacterium]|jgi:CDP-glycerol glycerophosphotransferase|nr:glycosyltransferase [Oscillospiraceae bacterium]